MLIFKTVLVLSITSCYPSRTLPQKPPRRAASLFRRCGRFFSVGAVRFAHLSPPQKNRFGWDCFVLLLCVLVTVHFSDKELLRPDSSPIRFFSVGAVRFAHLSPPQKKRFCWDCFVLLLCVLFTVHFFDYDCIPPEIFCYH
jgi:hypothetical protein